MTEPLYKGIRDVANIVGVEVHTLRFWEKKFPYLKPKKIGGHNRFYTAEDIAYLQQIHHYLKNEGYTTQGVLRLIKTHGLKVFREGITSTVTAHDDSVVCDSISTMSLSSNTATQNPSKNINAYPKDTQKTQMLITDVENILARLKKLHNMIQQ